MTKEHLKHITVKRVVPDALTKTDAAAPPKSTSRSENAIHLTLASVIALCFLDSCESTNYVPPVTMQMAAEASRSGTHVGIAKLNEGRTLFVHRCIECHTLPPIWKYSREDWPEIVNEMSHRASLKPAERDTVIAYILAVRSTER